MASAQHFPAQWVPHFGTTVQTSGLSSPYGLSVRPLGYWMAQLSAPDLPVSLGREERGLGEGSRVLELGFQ